MSAATAAAWPGKEPKQQLTSGGAAAMLERRSVAVKD
jgi:hypothetical protein